MLSSTRILFKPLRWSKFAQKNVWNNLWFSGACAAILKPGYMIQSDWNDERVSVQSNWEFIFSKIKENCTLKWKKKAQAIPAVINAEESF